MKYRKIAKIRHPQNALHKDEKEIIETSFYSFPGLLNQERFIFI